MKKLDVLRIVTAGALALLAIAALAFTYQSAQSARGGGVAGSVEARLSPAGASDVLLSPGGEPVPGGPGFISISSFFFKAYPTDLPYSHNGAMLYSLDAFLPRFFIAGALLPHGATVTKFVVYYQDTTGFYDLSAYLVVSNLDSLTSAVMAQVTSSGADENVRYLEDSSILYPQVDNQAYHYMVHAELPPSSQVGLVAVRIDYAYEVSAALIKK